MGKIFSNILLALILLSVIFFGITIVNSNDRAYFANVKVLVKLELLEKSLENQQRFAINTTATTRVNSEIEKVANVEFYDQNANFGGELIRAISADTQNLNAIINNDATASTFVGICSSTLAERNYENPDIFQPMLAESWELLDNKKSYKITLRKNAMWESFIDVDTKERVEAKEITAYDFKFYVDVVKNVEVNASPLRIYYQDLSDIEIINDYEFIVHWDKSLYGNLESTLSMMPLPKHFYLHEDEEFDPIKFNTDNERNRTIISSGPYKFIQWDKDSKVVFEANDKFWGRNYGIEPPIKKLVFELIKHPNTRYQALVSGKLGQLNLTPDQWTLKTQTDEFKKANLKTYKTLSNSYFYIGYNLKNPLFEDKIVRQALTHLVNRERIIKDIFKDEAEIVTGPFFKNSTYNDKNIKPYPFDVEEAKRLLAKAGWTDSDNDGILDKNGKKFEFTILAISSHPIQEKMLPLIKEDMAKAAIDMKIQVVEWSVYLQKLQNRDFEVCTLGWTAPYQSDPYQIWHSSQAEINGSSNHIGFKNSRADKLIEELQETFDIEKRIELAHEFHQLIHEEQPYTFLVAPYSLGALSEKYKNFRIFPNGVPSIIWYEQ